MSKKATDTKTRIVHTATNLFSSHGFVATSIDDIIAAVGITKGAFYHHFKSKEHLCEVVLDEAMASYTQVAATVQEQNEPDQALRAWFSRLLELQSSGLWLNDRLIGRLSIESGSLGIDTQTKLKSFWNWSVSFYELLIRQALHPASRFIEQPAALARLFTAAHFGSVWLDRCTPWQDGFTGVYESLLRLTVAAQ